METYSSQVPSPLKSLTCTFSIISGLIPKFFGFTGARFRERCLFGQLVLQCPQCLLVMLSINYFLHTSVCYTQETLAVRSQSSCPSLVLFIERVRASLLIVQEIFHLELWRYFAIFTLQNVVIMFPKYTMFHTCDNQGPG